MHLEDKSSVIFRIEWHDLTDISDTSGCVVTGQQVLEARVTKYKLTASEACLFLPNALRAKSNRNKAQAANSMDFSQWNFNERTHTLSQVKILMSMTFDEANSIISVKPMVHLTVQVKMRKGTCVCLG